MSYENREVPEGINLTDTHPLKDFTWMVAAVGGIIIGVVFILTLSVNLLLPFIPFSLEIALADKLENTLWNDSAASVEAQKIEDYLQDLADRLAKEQRLPEEMKITIHYVEKDTVNALATLGGNIVVFKGLIEKLSSENALAIISGVSENTMADYLTDSAGRISLLKFSRDQEEAADELALLSQYGLYRHINGAPELFEVLMGEQSDLQPPEFLSTHPISQDRIETISQTAAKKGWSQIGELQPLPDFIR